MLPFVGRRTCDCRIKRHINFELLHDVRRGSNVLCLASAHSLVRRNEERKPGAESLRPSHRLSLSLGRNPAPFWPSFLQSPHRRRPAKASGGLIVLAHPHAQKLGNTSTRLLPHFQPSRARARKRCTRSTNRMQIGAVGESWVSLLLAAETCTRRMRRPPLSPGGLHVTTTS